MFKIESNKDKTHGLVDHLGFHNNKIAILTDTTMFLHNVTQISNSDKVVCGDILSSTINNTDTSSKFSDYLLWVLPRIVYLSLSITSQ